MSETEKPRLLLVEDSRALAGLVEKRLETAYEVCCAYSGEEAMRFIKNSPPFAAAVVDLVLPKADGFEVMRYLGEQGRKTPVVVITARPRNTVEKDVTAAGAVGLLIKPFDFAVLEKTVKDAINSIRRQQTGEPVVNPANGKKLPLRVAHKSCFICGYQKVHAFLPMKEGFTEDWSRGAYPVFSPKGGFEPWDFLKTYVMVCPYCFFASSDPEDFAATPDTPYPYSEESKKILARSITVRKRLVPEYKDIDTRFDSPFRNKDKVFQALQLANKCCNGLILAGKEGSYAQTGVYCAMLGALIHPDGESFYRESFTSFENQLKIKETPRATLVKTYYYCIVLNMLLARTAYGRVIMQNVEALYQDQRFEDIKEDERDWLVRINFTWKHGIDYNNPREIL